MERGLKVILKGGKTECYDPVQENEVAVVDGTLRITHVSPGAYEHPMAEVESYDWYSLFEKSDRVRVLSGAFAELVRRGWERGADSRDEHIGTVKRHYNSGFGGLEHVEVQFDDGAEIGFPPEFVELVAA